MRIWSLHPKYLDSKGLVALWRETLLAKHVLEGKTVAYRNHPQLVRFRESARPLDALHSYLGSVYADAVHRGFHFDLLKFRETAGHIFLPVTQGQLLYEFRHLLAKLEKRDRSLYKKMILITEIEPHPLFRIIEGDIEKWEIVRTGTLQPGTKQIPAI